MNLNKKTKKNLLYTILLISILSLAFFLRAYNIDHVPAGLYPDEAVNGMDAYKTYAGLQKIQWFYPDNNGREGLYINLIALTYPILGVTFFGIKFWSILFGVLTVLGTYLLTTEITRSRRAGLIAAFLVAISFWSINFSRIAFRAIILAPVLLFSFWLLFRGIRMKQIMPFAVGGFIFGLGLHTYIAFRIAPLILIALLISAILSRKQFIATYWKHASIFICFALMSAAPMLYTFYDHPEFLSSRSGSISVLSEEVNEGRPLLALGKSFGLSMQKFNFWGDQNWRHNYPPYPILNPIIGILFMIGLVTIIIRFFSLFYERFRTGQKDRKLEIYTFLLSWFFVMHIPEFMTAEGLPHALRAIGALPVVYIIATLPILWFLDKQPKQQGLTKIWKYILIITILALVGMFNSVKYHTYWANEPKQFESFNANLMLMSHYIQQLPADTEIHVEAGHMERIPIQLFNTSRSNIQYFFPEEKNSITIQNTRNFAIFMTDINEGIIENYADQLPTLTLETKGVESYDRFYMLKP